MKRPASIVTAILLVAAAFAIAWWSIKTPAVRDAASTADSASARSSVGGDGTPLTTTEPADLSSHRSVPPLSMTVEDAHGRVIPAARVTWTVLTDELLGLTSQWPDLDWESLASATCVATTDERGMCTLAGPPHVGEERVAILFVEKLGYRTRALGLSASEGRLPSRVELEPCESIEAVVTDGEDHPMEDAQVDLWIDCQRDDLIGACDEAQALRRCFRSTVRTDASGHAFLPRPASAWRIQASKGDLASDALSGVDAPRLRLRLVPTFGFSARVTNWASVGRAERASVRWLVDEGDVPRFVRRMPVGMDGVLAFVRLPCIAGRAYEFQLEGRGLAIEQVQTVVPGVGTKVDLEFHAQPSFDIDVLVLDEFGRGLPDAVVTSNWNIQSVWTKVERATGADGVAHLHGIPAAQLWLRVRHSGYAARLVDPFEVVASLPTPVRVQLQKAGRLSGHCIHAGGPVRDFTIRVWTKDPNDHCSQDFHDREDGSFEVDEAPIGSVTVFAMSRAFPSPHEMQAQVTEGVTTTLTIEFPDALVGRGRVIDATTQEPLPGATVQLWSSLPMMRVRPWRTPVGVDARGEFRIEGFGPATTWTQFGAEGYGDRIVAVQGAPSGELDLGWIGLYAKQTLTVQLRETEGLDPTAYTCDLQGGEYYDAVHFSKDGRVRFEGLAPGLYDLWINAPDHMAYFEQVKLVPGRDLVLDMPIRGRHLTVHVKTPAEDPIPKASTLAVLFVRSSGFDHEQQYELKPGVPVDVRCITTASVVLEVREPSGLPRAVRRVEFDDRGPAEVEILVESSHRRLRVLDEDRKRLATGRVFLTAEGCGNWMQALDLDEVGECTVGDVGVSRLYAAAYDADRGLQASAPIDFSSGSEGIVEIRFAPKRTLAVRLMERERPSPGLDASATDVRGIAWGLGSRTTDNEGIARWPRVSRGDYVVRLEHPGWWPLEATMRLGNADSTADVQVRRVGSLLFVVKNVLGNAVAGARVELKSSEMNTAVLDWIAQDRVRVSSTSSETDASGTLRYDGLPNGPYTWTVTSPSGDVVTGELAVPPQGVGHAEAHVP